MPIDKFGRSFKSSSARSSLLSKFHTARSLKYTIDGDIDVENLKICNVKTPTLDDEVTNKKYVDNLITYSTGLIETQNINRYRSNATNISTLQDENKDFQKRMTTIESRVSHLLGGLNNHTNQDRESDSVTNSQNKFFTEYSFFKDKTHRSISECRGSLELIRQELTSLKESLNNES